MRAVEPRDHPARDRYFSREEWRTVPPTYEREGLITRQGARWALTDSGRAHIEVALYDDVDGPDTLPFEVVVGPMATGSVVMERPEIWDELGGMGVRDITGLEMEAAAIATVAQTEQVPFVLVAKGVMDHAANKDDRFKRFAANASAEVLFALLTRIAETITRPTGDDTRATESDWRVRLRRQGLRIWTPAQFAAGLRVTEPAAPAPPFRQDEVINVFTLEAGRLPNLSDRVRRCRAGLRRLGTPRAPETGRGRVPGPLARERGGPAPEQGAACRAIASAERRPRGLRRGPGPRARC